jgi:hypothetical protein
MADLRRTVTSATVKPADPEALIPAFDNPDEAGSNPTGSVLICDDRPMVGLELSQTFRRFLPSIAPVNASVVGDGFALVDAFETTAADLVLIGIHADTTAGIDAINLLLGIRPGASAVVYGSLADADLLAAAYARGAGGLLVWEPTAGQPARSQDRTTRCAGANPRPVRSRRH